MASKGGTVTSGEAESILEALDTGLPVRQVARQFDRSPSTISRIAKRGGLNLECANTKKAIQANKAYGLIRRLKANDKALTKFEAMLDRCDSATDLRNLAVAYGIFIDKRILEEPRREGERGGEIGQLIKKIKGGA